MWHLVAIILCFAPFATSNILNTYSDNIPDLEVNYKGMNAECANIIRYATNATDKLWWLKMIDASSRIPSGILSGHILDYGHFDECLGIEFEIEEQVVLGKYCAFGVVVDMDKIKLMLSICLPSVCEGATFFTTSSNLIQLSMNEATCQTKDSYGDWHWSEYTVVSVLGVVLGVMIISTIFDVYLRHKRKESPHLILIAFSIYSNGEKLLATTNNPDQIHCFNGLRFISMIWIIAGHRFASIEAFPLINTISALEWKKDMATAYIQGAPVAVDTFFFMSAFLISYGYFKQVEKKVLTLSKIPMLYFHRLFRLTPAIAVLFFVHVTFLKRVGSGPLWFLISDGIKDTCLEWWWTYFLYIQNYVNYDNMCMLQTWYLSADMQMFVLAPFLVITLGYFVRKNKKWIACWICVVLILLCMAIEMGIDFARDNKNEYQTHLRLPLYIIGILMGMVMKDLKASKFKIPSFWNVVIWGIFLSEMLVVILYTQDIRNFPTYFKTNMFNTFTRPAWTLGLCWLSYSCSVGTGGFINWMLSRPIFQVTSRLNYSMYLLHASVIMMNLGYGRAAINFSVYEAVYYFCGDFILTTIVSVVWVLAFESPIIIIEKIIFGRGKQNKKNAEPTIEVPPLKAIEGPSAPSDDTKNIP